MGESLRAPFLGESVAKDPQQGSKGSLTYCSGDPLGKRFWVESKKLWKVAGPAIFSRLATYGMNVITQAFAGHLGDLELAAISISSTVVVGLNFGLMRLALESPLVSLVRIFEMENPGGLPGQTRHTWVGDRNTEAFSCAGLDTYWQQRTFHLIVFSAHRLRSTIYDTYAVGVNLINK